VNGDARRAAIISYQISGFSLFITINAIRRENLAIGTGRPDKCVTHGLSQRLIFDGLRVFVGGAGTADEEIVVVALFVEFKEADEDVVAEVGGAVET
jgi:hypothetical protein